MDGEFEIYGARLNGQIRVGKIVLKDPEIDLVSVFPVGNLGFTFFRDRVLTFDPANRRVRFEEQR